MNRRGALLILLAALPTASLAQMSGGGGGGGRGGGRGGRGGKSGDSAPSTTKPDAQPLPPQQPVTEVEIIGVIKAIDPQTERITVAYEASDALNLPAGTMPFEVAKSALMKDAAVGEKIRFKLDSHQISAIRPF
jgi:Cu/Ag efflux protein CusF